jgi:hypothetical protein
MQPMYYIGLDVHKRTISYCVKNGSGAIHAEGTVATYRDNPPRTALRISDDPTYCPDAIARTWPRARTKRGKAPPSNNTGTRTANVDLNEWVRAA